MAPRHATRVAGVGGSKPQYHSNGGRTASTGSYSTIAGSARWVRDRLSAGTGSSACHPHSTAAGAGLSTGSVVADCGRLGGVLAQPDPTVASIQGTSQACPGQPHPDSPGTHRPLRSIPGGTTACPHAAANVSDSDAGT